MICKNCGAEIDDTLLLCPYCSTENETVAEKEHKEEVNDLLDKAEELKARPEQIAKKVEHKVSRAARYGVISFVVLLFAVIIVSRIIGDPSVRKMEKKIAKLESFYTAGDYADMCECLDGMEDTYGEKFRKYRTVQRVYRWMDNQENSYGIVKEYREKKSQGESQTQIASRALGTSRDLLYEIQKAETAGFRYGESEAMLYFREEIYRLMKEATDITEEEVERFFMNLPEDTESWPELTELAESLMAR